jgi:hypothetical protein
MEGISQGNMVLEHQLFNAPKFTGRYAIIAGQPNTRLQPKLTLTVRRTDVHVCRLTPLVGVEMKPK